MRKRIIKELRKSNNNMRLLKKTYEYRLISPWI
jgi:hypothetical protein